MRDVPELTQIVIAIDPAGTTNPDSDETGMVAVGIDAAPAHAYVWPTPRAPTRPRLGPARRWASTSCWAQTHRRRGQLRRRLGRGNLQARSRQRPVEPVHASRGKPIRAEPVAAPTNRAACTSWVAFHELELQMTTWSPLEDSHSPDRLDALVHACQKTLFGSRQWSIEEIMAWGRDDIDALRAMERGSYGGS